MAPLDALYAALVADDADQSLASGLISEALYIADQGECFV